MENSTVQHTFSAEQVFDSHYMDARLLYLQLYKQLPCVHYISGINGEKSWQSLKTKSADRIIREWSYRWFSLTARKYHFDTTIVQLQDNVLVEFDEGYAQIMHDGRDPEVIRLLTLQFRQFKVRNRREPREINLVVQGDRGLYLQGMEIKASKLDLDFFYEDDFKAVDRQIMQRLKADKDKGIVLLHGLPGTGKTTYLRHLVGKIKKRILFLSPSIAGSLTDPGFIRLLTSNPNSVLIIEDAENIIMDRRFSSQSSVSNLLNISDGLLADFLNVQIICTFNSPLTMVDQALLRKGRLIAKYEFGKLSVPKARKLAAHLGIKVKIEQPMTIAEITNPHEKEVVVQRPEIIGFRIPEVPVN